MGGPNHISEVEVFLKNMFSDPYILPVKNRFLRKFIGANIVRKRLQKARENYRAIGGKSPITAYTFSLCQKLQQLDPHRFYSYAMRYTPPFTQMVLSEMQQKGIKKITLFSMYPQYSTTTTLSSFSEVYRCLKLLNYEPIIEVVDRYYENEAYLQIMAQAIIKMLKNQESRDYVLIFSAHSLPQSIIDSGDPYQKECQRSFDLMREYFQKNNMIFKDIALSYQSKIGRMQWIGPSTQNMIEKYANQKIVVYPLGFTIDNSETIFEIAIEYRELAKKHGVQDFVVCPCFNDDDAFAKLILELT